MRADEIFVDPEFERVSDEQDEDEEIAGKSGRVNISGAVCTVYYGSNRLFFLIIIIGIAYYYIHMLIYDCITP